MLRNNEIVGLTIEYFSNYYFVPLSIELTCFGGVKTIRSVAGCFRRLTCIIGFGEQNGLI